MVKIICVLRNNVKHVHSGSRRPPGLTGRRNAPSCDRPVPAYDGECRPTWALVKVPRALPVGLHASLVAHLDNPIWFIYG
jgi:hypothetical protein